MSKQTLQTFRRQFDPNYKGSKGEINDEKSQTVPDMSLTCRELLINHTRSIHSDVSVKEGEYFEELEIPVFVDITDAIAYKERLKENLAETERIIKTEKEALKQAQIDKAREQAQKDKKDEPTPLESSPEPPPQETKED